tara:strand:- start:172 stop:702 length:531 start_codon:yes stop_codon:yes gene_type:complete
MKLKLKDYFIFHITFWKQLNCLKIRFFISLTVLIITCSIPAINFASEIEEYEARFEKLSNELRCPTCQGLAVKDSEAGFSSSIKGKIRELMKRGKSDEEILEYFVNRYGEWILRSPPVSGFNLVLWVLPVFAIVSGLLWIIFKSKKWVEKPTNGITQLTSEEEQKIMDDLDRFENS